MGTKNPIRFRKIDCRGLSGIRTRRHLTGCLGGRLLHEAFLDIPSSFLRVGVDTPAVSCVLYPDLYPWVLISGGPVTVSAKRGGGCRQVAGPVPGVSLSHPAVALQAGKGTLPASRLFRKRFETGLMLMNTWARFVFKVLYKHLISPRGGAAALFFISVRPGAQAAAQSRLGGGAGWGALPSPPPPCSGWGGPRSSASSRVFSCHLCSTPEK